MAKIRGEFVQLHQDSQDYGSDDQHMVSRVFFFIAVDGKVVTDDQGKPKQIHATVKLPVGGDYLKDELEVGRPEGYRGEWNHAAFADAVRTYVRACVGPGASGISSGGGGSVRMRDNIFEISMRFEFDAASDSPRTW